MTFKLSESILFLKKAKKLGKRGGSHDFQSKWINFNAKKAKKLGKIGDSKWINFNAEKGKKFGQNWG